MSIDSGSAEAQARDRLAEIGFAEVERQLAAAREDVARLRRALGEIGSCQCPCQPVGNCLVLDDGTGKELRCLSCIARAALAAQSLAPSKCECHIERNPSRMSAAALESGASAEIVGPLCAFCRANARKPPAPGATDGERLDWLEKHGSEIDRPVEHETDVKHTGLCWYPDPFEDKELFIQGENLRAAIDAAIRAKRGGK